MSKRLVLVGVLVLLFSSMGHAEEGVRVDLEIKNLYEEVGDESIVHVYLTYINSEDTIKIKKMMSYAKIAVRSTDPSVADFIVGGGGYNKLNHPFSAGTAGVLESATSDYEANFNKLWYPYLPLYPNERIFIGDLKLEINKAGKFDIFVYGYETHVYFNKGGYLIEQTNLPGTRTRVIGPSSESYVQTIKGATLAHNICIPKTVSACTQNVECGITIIDDGCGGEIGCSYPNTCGTGEVCIDNACAAAAEKALPTGASDQDKTLLGKIATALGGANKDLKFAGIINAIVVWFNSSN